MFNTYHFTHCHTLTDTWTDASWASLERASGLKVLSGGPDAASLATTSVCIEGQVVDARPESAYPTRAPFRLLDDVDACSQPLERYLLSLPSYTSARPRTWRTAVHLPPPVGASEVHC